MAHPGLTAAQTAHDKPVDQILTDIVRLADIDLTERIQALEGESGYFFTHFANDHRYASGIVLSNTGAATLQNYDKDFTLKVDGGIITEKVAVTADAHHLEFKRSGPTDAGRHMIELNREIVFENYATPTIFRTRWKIEDNSSIPLNGMFIGLHDGQITPARPANGIYLEVQIQNTLWRFVSSRSSVNTVGTGFAPPAAGFWFEIVIFWDGSGASCRINDSIGVLREAELLTTNLPFDRAIYPCGQITTSNTTVDAVNLDRFGAAHGLPLVP